jgi:hypothetical protein
MIKSLKGKRNFATVITELPKSLLANSGKVPREQKLLANTAKAITLFNTVILRTHTQKTVYRLCMKKL